MYIIHTMIWKCNYNKQSTVELGACFGDILHIILLISFKLNHCHWGDYNLEGTLDKGK